MKSKGNDSVAKGHFGRPFSSAISVYQNSFFNKNTGFSKVFQEHK